MSNYPIWWNSTITIYNKHEDAATQLITWQKIVLKNCFWKLHINTYYSNGQISETSSPIITCRIPKSSKYVDSYTWKTLDATTRAKKFTLQNGDIIIKGNIADTINEYQKGSRASDLVNRYKDKGLLTISLVVDNSDDTLFLKHYFVR